MKIVIEKVKNGYIVNIEKPKVDITDKIGPIMQEYLTNVKDLFKPEEEGDPLLNKIHKDNEVKEQPVQNNDSAQKIMESILGAMKEEDASGSFIFIKPEEALDKIASILL